MGGKSSGLSGRLFVSALALASFSEQNLDLLVGLLILDIALTFQVTVGIASQIVTISKIASIATGLVIGTLSTKFNQKRLLLTGIAVVTIGMLGSLLAPNFTYLQFFYPLDGVGSVIIAAMSLALIGAFLPLEKRPRAIGWVVAAGSLCWVIGAPMLGIIANFGGWRDVLAWFMLPISILSFVLVLVYVPSGSKKLAIKFDKKVYVDSFTRVFKNRSASACLVGVVFASFLQSWAIFAITFYRTRFSVPLEFASIILLVVTLFFALGGIVGGRIINKVGRKRVLVISVTIRSFIIATIVFTPILWFALVIDLVNTLCGGMSVAAFGSLNVEQVPESRGTMMSLGAMFGALGGALGATIGGSVLDQFGFQILGPTFAVAGIASALVVFFLAKDTYRK
jgi:predicted MFS family arabinose efflux permease